VGDPIILSQGIEIAPEGLTFAQVLQSQESPADEARQHTHRKEEPGPSRPAGNML